MTEPDTVVNVHRNLTWSGGQGFSILDRSFRVVDRALYVELADCVFVVHDSGNKRAMETGVRNVHAFVRGGLVRCGNRRGDISIPGGVVEVLYNPFDDRGFTTADDDKEIWSAGRVWFADGKAYVR